MKLHFDDEYLDGQLQRSVVKADSGMANVGECLAIAEQIAPGDRDSWFRAWSDFAARLVEQADVALADGHRVSTRQALPSPVDRGPPSCTSAATTAPTRSSTPRNPSALDRGYAFVAVDGPGQGARLYNESIPHAAGLGERGTGHGR